MADREFKFSGAEATAAYRAAEILDEATAETGWEEDDQLFHMLSFVGLLASKNENVLELLEEYLDDAVVIELEDLDDDLEEDDDEEDEEFEDEEEEE